MRASLDAEPDPRAWVRAAVAACLDVWQRDGARYARRLRESDRLREPVDDVMTLAARRLAPLPVPRLRPLPTGQLEPLARAFNALPEADRFALLRLRRLAGVRGARAAHLASALERLVAAHRRDRLLNSGDARHAPDCSGTSEDGRPPPGPGGGRSLQALDASSTTDPSSECHWPSAPLR